MAKLYDLAEVYTTSTGSGTVIAGSATTGSINFIEAGIQDGDTISYGISDGNSNEVGRGVYTASASSLSRSVLKSTNGGSPLNLSGSSKIFITALAEDIGNVLGNASVTDGHLAVFDGDGYHIKDGGPVRGGDVSRSGATTDGHLAVWDGNSESSIKEGGAVPIVPTFVGARYNSNAAQSIVNNATIAIIDFEDEVYDTNDAVTVGAAWKFTAPSTGYYHIDVFLLFASSAGWASGERVLLQLNKGGTLLVTLDRVDWNSSGGTGTQMCVKGSVTINLTASEYIDVRVAQNSGGNISLSNLGEQVWINIEKIH